MTKIRPSNIEGTTVEAEFVEGTDFEVSLRRRRPRYYHSKSIRAAAATEFKGSFEYFVTGGAWTACTENDFDTDVDSDLVCLCDNTAATSKCKVRYTPNPAWDPGLDANTMSRAFKYKIRDNVYTDGVNKLVSQDATLDIQYVARLLAYDGTYSNVLENYTGYTNLKIERDNANTDNAAHPKYGDADNSTTNNTATKVMITALAGLEIDGCAAPSVGSPCVITTCNTTGADPVAKYL